jgi:hypothetical protein
MYAWLWHVLPGGRGARVLQLLALALVLLALLWFWVFPRVSDSYSFYSLLPPNLSPVP